MEELGPKNQRFYLEDQMYEHFESVFSWIFAGDIGSREVKHVGPHLITYSLDQHLLPCTPWASQEDRLSQWCLFVDCLGTLKIRSNITNLP